MMKTEVKVIREASQNTSLFESVLNAHLADGWKLRGQMVAVDNYLHHMVYKETYE